MAHTSQMGVLAIAADVRNKCTLFLLYFPVLSEFVIHLEVHLVFTSINLVVQFALLFIDNFT